MCIGHSGTCLSSNQAHSFEERLHRFSCQHGGTYGPTAPLHVSNNRDNRAAVDEHDPMHGAGETLDFTVVATSPMAMSAPQTLQLLRKEFAKWKHDRVVEQEQEGHKKIVAKDQELCATREQHERDLKIHNDTGTTGYHANQMSRIRTWPADATTHFPNFLQQTQPAMQRQRAEAPVLRVAPLVPPAMAKLELELQAHLAHLMAGVAGAGSTGDTGDKESAEFIVAKLAALSSSSPTLRQEV